MDKIDPEKYREHFKGNDELFGVFEKITNTLFNTDHRRLLQDMKNVAHFKAKERL